MHIANGLQALGSDGIRKVFFGRMSVAPEAGDARARAAHEPDPAVTIAALRADIIRMQTEMIESVNTILVDATARDAQLLSAIRAMQAVVVASQQARENMHDQRRQRVEALEVNVAALAEDLDDEETEHDEPSPLWYGERNIEARRVEAEEGAARTWMESLSSLFFGPPWSTHEAPPQRFGTRASRRRTMPGSLNVTARIARRQIHGVQPGPNGSPLRYGSNILCIGGRRPEHTGVPDCTAVDGRHRFNGLGSNRYQKKYNCEICGISVSE